MFQGLSDNTYNNKIKKSNEIKNVNFIEITFQHGCFPVNFLQISRIHFPKKASGGLLLSLALTVYYKHFTKFLNFHSLSTQVKTKL